MLELYGMFYRSSGIVMSLPDGALTSSEDNSVDYAIIYGRIGAEKVSGKAHAWCGKPDGEKIATVDLTSSYLVTGVATQGRGDAAAQWVTAYSVRTSENGYDWVYQGKFVGNFDPDTICQVRFEKPVIARFVEFTVLEAHGFPCMRFDVLVLQ